MGYFDNGVTTDYEAAGIDNAQAAGLEKALAAGYGSNPSEFSGGRALIPEDLESTLTNILASTKNDCKMFSSLHTQPVKSTVHEIVRRTGYGDDRFNFIGEGEEANEDTQTLERKLYETKYLATIGSVTRQMELVASLEDAYESEKIAAVNRIAKNAEWAIFHGNSDVNPKEFDGFEKIVRDSAKEGGATRVDLHGMEIGEKTSDDDFEIKDAGEELLDDIATRVYQKGGDLDRAMFSPVVAKQFKKFYSDRLRFNTGDNRITFNELPDIVTATGSSIRIQGKDAGADKLYHVKGEVKAAGNVAKRPNAPTTVTAKVNASASDSHFFTKDAGEYAYVVHAINAAGISAGTAVAVAPTVAAGGSVTLTITPSNDGPIPTGYVITRSAPGGQKVMEMTSIKANGYSAVEFTDLNTELPGTASVLLLTSQDSMGKNAFSFGQLLPISSTPLPIERSLNKPFVVSMYGMLEVRDAEHQAIIDNIGYAGGLY